MLAALLADEHALRTAGQPQTGAGAGRPGFSAR